MRTFLLLALVSCSSTTDQPMDGGNDGMVVVPPGPDAGDDVVDAAPMMMDVIDASKDPIISRDPGQSQFEGETQVAVSSDGTVCAVWISTDYNASPGFSRIAYRFSFDRGDTWSPIKYVSQKSQDPTVDPSIAVDANGNFWIEYISIAYPNNMPGPGHVMVAKAPKGSDTFGAGVEASDPNGANKFRDHPKITVMKNGTIAVAFLEAQSFQNFSGPGIVATSSDGTTWKRAVLNAPPTQNDFDNLFYLCSSDTRLYAVYYEYVSNTVRVPLRYSDDNGTTWSQPTIVSAPMPYVGGVDPACVAKGNDVWIVYGTSLLQPPNQTSSQPMQAIRVAHSPDKGASIDTRTDMTDKTAGKVFLLPQIAQDGQGELDLVYYAGQMDKDMMGSFRRSRTQGGTIQPSIALATLQFLLERATPLWLGDYVGIAARNNELFTTYADNSGGMASHVGFQRVTLF